LWELPFELLPSLAGSLVGGFRTGGVEVKYQVLAAANIGGFFEADCCLVGHVFVLEILGKNNGMKVIKPTEKTKKQAVYK
jgi:hypothetical protein